MNSDEEDAGHVSKRAKLDDNLEGGIADLTKAKVTEVSSPYPHVGKLATSSMILLGLLGYIVSRRSL